MSSDGTGAGTIDPLVQLPQEFFLGSIDTYRVPIYCIEECLPPSSLLDQLLCERLDRRRHMELFCSRIAEVNPTGIEAAGMNLGRPYGIAPLHETIGINLP